MMRRGSIVCASPCSALLFAGLAIDYTERESLRPLARAMSGSRRSELGTPNIITGILLTYRGFDTLGEVAVLFMVAAGVGLVLGGGVRGQADHSPPPKARAGDAGERTGADRRQDPVSADHRSLRPTSS